MGTEMEKGTCSRSNGRFPTFFLRLKLPREHTQGTEATAQQEARGP